MKRVMYMMFGGLLALALVFGAAATFAYQSDDGEETATPEVESGDGESDDTQEEEAGSGESGTTAVPGFGRHGIGGNDEEALAEALGITVEELEAAYVEARTAAIEQAVADGLITQEQADEVLAQGDGFGRGHHGFLGGDKDEYLAEALGISAEELQAAKAEVLAAQLAAMVEAGVISQEQADLIAAREAVQNYVDQEALQAAVQSAYERAVEEAVDAGVISQEQADQLLEELANSMVPGFGFGGFGGFGGRGHHHGGGFRGGPGFGIPVLPDSETTPAEPTIDA